jgi:general secretion pathway protein I
VRGALVHQSSPARGRWQPKADGGGGCQNARCDSSPSGAARHLPLAGEDCRSDGFSLIEALVALSVLAIASVGLMRTVESHIDSTRALERRAAAMWVAENRLAEMTFDPAPANQVEMLGQQWRVAVSSTKTDDPDIVKVHVEVFGTESTPLASLDGFVDGRRS